MQQLPHLGEAAHFLADRRRPAIELLSERHRHGVLQVCTPHLQHALELVGLAAECFLQPPQGVHVARQAQNQRQPERGRIDVVGRLAVIDVIIRIEILILALAMPEALQRQIGDDLVGIHVGRGTGTALDEVGDELIAQFAGDQAVTGAGNGIGETRIEHAEVAVGQRCRLLDIAESLDEIRLGRHRDAGNVEVLLAAQRLHTVVGVVRQFLLAQKVLLDSCHGDSFQLIGLLVDATPSF
ncbi:MAG: hypothetical protein FAZ92_02127 [Accumulibacter sp.]|nr:MAG: hypothetical protein FAZ92_02127 [Accumulibacter sp.]